MVSHTIVGECQIYTGRINGRGYGQVGKPIKGERLIHRIVYRDHHGAIPEGYQVNHKCGRRLCFNPDHLYAGTQSQNTQDAASHGTLHTVKLTEEEVLEIRAEYAAGTSQDDIALMYDITQVNVSMIVLRKTWKHI